MANVLVNDPNIEECPDYSLQIYAGVRQALVDKGMAEQEALDFLKVLWETANGATKLQWQQQLDAMRTAAADDAQLAKEAEDARIAAENEEAEAAKKEERKKNREKYLPVSVGKMMPHRPPLSLAPALLQKLKKVEYLELWFATDEGLRAMSQEVGMMEGQAFTMARNEDGQFTMVPTIATKASKLLVKDEDLSWEQFSVGSVRFLQLAEDAGWSREWIDMLGGFFAGLQVHEWNLGLNKTGCDRRALLIYQARQRRAWHLHIKNEGEVMDLSVINQTALLHAWEEAMRWRQDQVLREYELRGARDCVWTSNPGDDATSPPTPTVTSVWAVAQQGTEPRTVLKRKGLEVRTPYDAGTWRRVLGELGLEEEFRSVVRGLESGFMVGFPRVERTQTPGNRIGAGDHQEHFRRIVEAEVAKGRYVGPFSQSEVERLLGPFQSSPISIIPKSTPGKFRVIQNFSYPWKPAVDCPLPSVNSHIDASDFPCTWGTFRAMCILVAALPTGSQMAVRDVSEAYRTVPLHPSQWPAGVVRGLDDEFLVDLCAAFGSASSGGVFGALADAICAIFRASGMGPLSKWVDDFPFIRVLRDKVEEFNVLYAKWSMEIRQQGRHQSRSRIWFGGGEMENGEVFEMFEDCSAPLRDLSEVSPRSEEDAHYTYCMDDVDRISGRLGIPWERTKDVPFYIGFLWDLEARTVSLPTEKAEKYGAAIDEWLGREVHTLEDVQQLYGKLLHASLVVLSGRARLTGLEHALGLAGDRPFVPRHPPRSVRGDLGWWRARLREPSITRSVVVPSRPLDISAYSDASTGTGITVVIGERWRAWRLLPGWRTRDGEKDIGWAEAVGFYLLTITVARDYPPGTHFRLYGDNEGVVGAWRNFRSRNTAVNNIFKLIHNFLEDYGSVGCIQCRYVPTDRNPADGPSRGIFPASNLLLPPIRLPEVLAPFIVDASAPHSAIQLQHQQRTSRQEQATQAPEEGEQRGPARDFVDDCKFDFLVETIQSHEF